MQITSGSYDDLVRRLGANRVVAPAGALPQPAERLDASGPMRAAEFEVEVERLCLDATSLRNLRDRAHGDPDRMAARILEIVGTRASLTLTPLRLEAVTHVDPGSAHVEVAGTAYVSDSAPWGPVPDDLPVDVVLDVYDVYGAASHTRNLLEPGQTICVLGLGHAGKLALAAARDIGAGTVIAVDVDPAAVARAAEAGLADVAVAADLRDPLAAVRAVREAGGPPADLTVVVVNATGCEPAAILLTAEHGTVLFFSMATTFTTAALTADGMGHDVRMLVGSGYTPDVGAYALDLVRRSGALKTAWGLQPAERL